jgi:hypothetical protein
MAPWKRTWLLQRNCCCGRRSDFGPVRQGHVQRARRPPQAQTLARRLGDTAHCLRGDRSCAPMAKPVHTNTVRTGTCRGAALRARATVCGAHGRLRTSQDFRHESRPLVSACTEVETAGWRISPVEVHSLARGHGLMSMPRRRQPFSRNGSGCQSCRGTSLAPQVRLMRNECASPQSLA